MTSCLLWAYCSTADTYCFFTGSVKRFFSSMINPIRL